MSQMDTDEQVSARAAAPIVLVIDSPDAQKYLENNEVLRTLYGNQAPVRASTDYHLAQELFHPENQSAEQRIALFERFPDVPASGMDALIKSERFFAVVFEYIVQVTGITAEDAGNVRAVICNEDLFIEPGSIREVIRRYFPTADAFKMEYRGNGRPTRVDLS